MKCQGTFTLINSYGFLGSTCQSPGFQLPLNWSLDEIICGLLGRGRGKKPRPPPRPARFCVLQWWNSASLELAGHGREDDLDLLHHPSRFLRLFSQLSRPCIQSRTTETLTSCKHVSAQTHSMQLWVFPARDLQKENKSDYCESGRDICLDWVERGFLRSGRKQNCEFSDTVLGMPIPLLSGSFTLGTHRCPCSCPSVPSTLLLHPVHTCCQPKC